MIAAEAPSNIALIKYMGKASTKEDINRPTNASISLTLPNLKSRVEIEPYQGSKDLWEPLSSSDWGVGELSEKGMKKFLGHFAFLKAEMGIEGNYRIKSGNNFPADCGIASSASSFAALTMAAYQLGQSENPSLDLNQNQLAELSRRGLGSSCRSFGGPFVEWNKDGIVERDILGEFFHEVLILEDSKKSVSSSEAHQRVLTSSMFPGRVERAEKRLATLIESLETKNWQAAWQTSWDEFLDMHMLFQTSNPPFQYMTDKSFALISQIRKWSETKTVLPLVTMDAGANIHLIYHKGQKSIADDLAQAGFDFDILRGCE